VRITIALALSLAACGGGAGDDTPVFGTSGPYFDNLMFFNQDVSGSSPAASSSAIISSLRAGGGWGNDDLFQIDFSFDVLLADAATPLRSFTPTGDFFRPDCDQVDIPVPANGNVEGEDGLACTSGGDCHLLVYDPEAGKLFEMWRADVGSTFRGGCLAVWDTRMTYGETLRGDQCTSADAAGFPIAPLLFTADEVAAGVIDHAIRFILPNERIRRGYVRPATHATDTDGGADAPSYGVHLRLKSSFDVASLPSEGARVVARALQKYGMYHADGGNIALTAQSDRYTTAKWDGLLEPRDLRALQVEDFEVIDHGPPITLTLDCER
jgi:serine/threonine-protein kinase